jgi:hypothetical protein
LLCVMSSKNMTFTGLCKHGHCTGKLH